jgi:hypothetical protein
MKGKAGASERYKTGRKQGGPRRPQCGGGAVRPVSRTPAPPTPSARRAHTFVCACEPRGRGCAGKPLAGTHPPPFSPPPPTQTGPDLHHLERLGRHRGVGERFAVVHVRGRGRGPGRGDVEKKSTGARVSAHSPLPLSPSIPPFPTSAHHAGPRGRCADVADAGRGGGPGAFVCSGGSACLPARHFSAFSPPAAAPLPRLHRRRPRARTLKDTPSDKMRALRSAQRQPTPKFPSGRAGRPPAD